jgi:hypothetical protein
MPLPETTQRWRALVTDLQQSGLPIREFAVRRDVNAKTLAWWRTKLARAPTSPTFVEQRLAPPSPSPVARAVRLSFTTMPVSVEVPVGTDLAWLRRVVEALT